MLPKKWYEIAAVSVEYQNRLLEDVKRPEIPSAWAENLGAAPAHSQQEGPSPTYRRADNSRPLSFTVCAWAWVYVTNLSRLQRETRERERETSKRHVGEAHSVLETAIQLPERPSCYWGKIVSLRMLTNFRLADLRLSTAQQRPTGQNLPSHLYVSHPSSWEVCPTEFDIWFANSATVDLN
jgi:hypothetical protein